VRACVGVRLWMGRRRETAHGCEEGWGGMPRFTASHIAIASREPSDHQRTAPPSAARRMAPLGPLLALVLTLAIGACAPGGVGVGAPSALSRTPASPTYRLTYVAIGASDSFGIGTDDPDEQSWPSVLAVDLGPGVHLVNLGIPGATVVEAQRAELPIALAADPDIVTIWLAVNDLAAGVPLATYQQELAALITSVREGTQARIFVANLPDLTLLPYLSGRDLSALSALIARWNAAIAAACAAGGATLVDLYSGWRELASHPEYIASDGLHPSAIGAARLAQIFAGVIQRPAAP
jgi:lysophospholipase L1-like esterase